MPIPLYPMLSFSIVSHQASLNHPPHHLSTLVWVVLYLFFLLIITTIYQAVQCFHIFLHPFDNYSIFFLQLPLSFQSSSINPFSPISPLIPSNSFQFPLKNLLYTPGLVHSNNLPKPLQSSIQSNTTHIYIH